MKLLLKLISVVTICSILLIGSQCHEQNDDNENDFQIEEELIQNEMKPELQVNDNDDKDMSNDDDYDDDAKNNGEDAMELEVEDPVKRDDDATEHDIGSKCLERSGDDDEDTPFAGIIQNEMKPSEMQDTDNQNTDNDNADADDAQKAGEDVMEFSDAGLDERDEDDDLGDPASSEQQVDDYDDDFLDDVGEEPEEDDVITKRSIPDDDDDDEIEIESLDKFKKDASAMGSRRRVFGGGRGRRGRRRWWKKK